MTMKDFIPKYFTSLNHDRPAADARIVIMGKAKGDRVLIWSLLGLRSIRAKAPGTLPLPYVPQSLQGNGGSITILFAMIVEE